MSDVLDVLTVSSPELSNVCVCVGVVVVGVGGVSGGNMCFGVGVGGVSGGNMCSGSGSAQRSLSLLALVVLSLLALLSLVVAVAAAVQSLADVF